MIDSASAKGHVHTYSGVFNIYCIYVSFRLLTTLHTGMPVMFCSFYQPILHCILLAAGK